MTGGCTMSDIDPWRRNERRPGDSLTDGWIALLDLWRFARYLPIILFPSTRVSELALSSNPHPPPSPVYEKWLRRTRAPVPSRASAQYEAPAPVLRTSP